MNCIIGIDPSINSTGICIRFDDDTYIYYIITSKMTLKQKKFNHPKVKFMPYEKINYTGLEYSEKETIKSHNFARLLNQLQLLIDEYKPSHVVMEGISYGSVSGSSLADLAGLNYIIRLLLIENSIPFSIVSPSSLKKFVCANGQAEKDVIIDSWKRMDKNINNITDVKVDDLADAFFLSNYPV